MTPEELAKPANFSTDRSYRYTLSRRLTTSLFSKIEMVILLCGYNPSTANESENDPTIRRELAFSKALDASLLIKVNLFARVATDPNDLAEMEDPVGDVNDAWIAAAIGSVKGNDGLLIAAWGVPKGSVSTRKLFLKRSREVMKMAKWKAFRLTKDGYPEHPLYLPKDSWKEITPLNHAD